MTRKTNLSERDICTKYITPALKDAGWDIQRQIREEVSFTAGRVIVRARAYAREREHQVVLAGVAERGRNEKACEC